MSDSKFMQRAIELAALGINTSMPNPRVGCVIVKADRIVAEGWHRKIGHAHAEVEALANINGNCQGCEVYINLEPCSHFGNTPPCVDALIKAKPAKVFVAIEDPDQRVAGRGIAKLQQTGIEVKLGMRVKAAKWINRGYFSRQRRGRPWVRVKLASSLDGKIALPSGVSQWITSAEARTDGHALRAQSCVIATGIGTAELDDPQLTVRAVETERMPIRVLFDSKLRCKPELKMFKGGAIVFSAAAKSNPKLPKAVELVSFDNGQGRVDLGAALAWLSEHKQANEVTFETGGMLVGALLKDDLVDEVVIYQAPMFLGEGHSNVSFTAPTSLAAAPNFKLRSVSKLGKDSKTILHRHNWDQWC